MIRSDMAHLGRRVTCSPCSLRFPKIRPQIAGRKKTRANHFDAYPLAHLQCGDIQCLPSFAFCWRLGVGLPLAS